MCEKNKNPNLHQETCIVVISENHLRLPFQCRMRTMRDNLMKFTKFVKIFVFVNEDVEYLMLDA